MAEPTIPRQGAPLTPDREREFQAFMAFDPNVRAWKNNYANRYGEQPNTGNDPQFDYREAYTSGNRPQPYGGDAGAYHWDSRGKAPDHPTEWMNDFMQRFGHDPMTLGQGQVTPEMQQYLQNRLGPQMPRTAQEYNRGGTVNRYDAGGSTERAIETELPAQYYAPEPAATPEVTQQPAQPDVQVAEAPPTGGPPTTLPEAYYAPDKKAIDTGAKPAPAAGGEPGKPAATAAPPKPQDFNDEAEYNAAIADWKLDRQILREHNGNFDPIVDKPDLVLPQNHPEYSKLVDLLALQEKFDKRQQREYGPRIEQMRNRVLRDTELRNVEANRAAKEKRAEQLRGIDGHPESIKAMQESGQIVDGVINGLRDKTKEAAANPRTKEGRQADFDLKTSPLGTVDSMHLRDAAAKIATLNGLRPDTALMLTLTIGSPVWKDDKTGEYGVGANGHKGKGALNFKVTGHDLRGNYTIRMRDGRQLRVDADSMELLDAARLRGYKASAQWDAEQAKKREEWEKMGTLGRLWQGLTQ